MCDNLCGSEQDADWQVSVLPFDAQGVGEGIEPVRYNFCSQACLVEFLDATS